MSDDGSTTSALDLVRPRFRLERGVTLTDLVVAR
jgi:hypothetical protein